MTEKPPQESVLLNVCIIPDRAVGSACEELSQSFRSDDTLFVLDGVHAFAHMTVFMARFPDYEVENVLATARQVVGRAKSFLCEHTGYFLTAGGYLEASYRRSEPLMSLHEQMVGALKDFRINPGAPFQEGYFAPYTDEQRRNAEETGYDLAHGLYRPHITLTRYAEGKMPYSFPGLAPAALSFPLKKVCVYKADDNGAVYEKITEFPAT